MNFLKVLGRMTFGLSESESQRYDRQIRVWGAEAQSKIQNSKALICGLNKINVEVCTHFIQVICSSLFAVGCKEYSIGWG